MTNEKQMNADAYNVVKPAELMAILENAVTELKNDPTMASQMPAFMLRGAPGVGKSTMVKAVAKKLGIGFRDVRLAQMERVDCAGIPSVEKYKGEDGKEYGRTTWNIPSFWPDAEKEPYGIILLDEITSAPSDVQVAAYSIVLDRCIPNSNYRLPDGWLIVAAGNRAQDKAVVKGMSSALANRFLHVDVEANFEDWLKWATVNQIHPAIPAYLQMRPQQLFQMSDNKTTLERGWASPRSWERVSTMLKMFGAVESILRKTVYGLIGNGTGGEFMEFYKQNRVYDDILVALKNEGKDWKLEKGITADRQWAITSALVYHLWNAEDEKDQQSRLRGFWKIFMQLGKDYQQLCATRIAEGTTKMTSAEACTKIMKCPEYKQYKDEFNKAFQNQGKGL